MGGGYIIRLGGVEYDAWRSGRPFTLVDCWRELEGVAGATILSPTGRVVLANAGSMRVRGWEVPLSAGRARNYARVAREAPLRALCPECGRACAQRRASALHPPTGPDGCTIESFSLPSLRAAA